MKQSKKTIEKNVLKKITPNEKERKNIEQVIEKLKKQVKKEIQKTRLPITIALVGSTAKDTYIRNAVDIDLFLVFPTTVSRETLQKQGLAIGRALLTKQEECFAEHPYVRGMYQGYKTEIVPCYKIESASQKLSAVDRTPLHTRYVKEHLKEQQKQEVRLLKQFLKGIGCYGAEAEIEGFSGYLCEILILRYGSFDRLITQARLWRQGETLTLQQETVPPFDTPLIFIDPVDQDRNVASAVSKEKFDLFVLACNEYTKTPRVTFFFPQKIRPWTLSKIRKVLEGKRFIGIRFPKPDIIAENLYPQVRKAVRSIQDFCEQNDFTIVDATFHIDEKTVYLILQPKTMMVSKTVLHTGPPINLGKNADEFLQKWKDNPRTRKKPFEKNNRWYVEIDREYTDIKELLQNQITQLGLGKHIDTIVRKRFVVIDDKELLTEPFRLFWTQYLDPRRSWER
jgi:tRNA nucleotidyltransferase (CCA-adding enzyme)